MAANEKKVSIIVPCYNAIATIPRLMDSLLSQTIGKENLEIILVDDASEDATYACLKQYEKENPSIVRAFHYEKNRRQGGARNEGMRHATARYIAFADADDFVEPLMYEHMTAKAEQYDTDVVFCRSRVCSDEQWFTKVRQNEKKDRFFQIETDQEREAFIVSNCLGYNVWDKLYTRQFLTKYSLQFPEQVAYEDIVFSSMAYIYLKRIYILEENLYHYWLNPQSTVHTMEQKYYRDHFTCSQIKWEAYKKSGALERYSAAVQFDYLMSFYMIGLQMLAVRFREFPYESFEELQRETLKHVPDIQDNPYIQTNCTPFQKILVEILYQKLSKNEAEEMAQTMRTYLKNNARFKQ